MDSTGTSAPSSAPSDSAATQTAELPAYSTTPPARKSRLAESRSVRIGILATVVTCVGLPAILAFGVFVWPTRYRYDHFKVGYRESPVRIDRITGETDVFDWDGWKSTVPVAAAPLSPLSPNQLALLNSYASIDDGGTLHYTTYNGSTQAVNSITIAITVKNADGSPVLSDRRYELGLDSSDGEPLKVSDYSCKLGFTLAPGQTWSSGIVDATATN
jgi:hypothetical protein